MTMPVATLDEKPQIEAFLDALDAKIAYAFQPIVNIQTGACLGYEALLRNQDALGFDRISDLFDHAYQLGCLHRADVKLRSIAIDRFNRIEGSGSRQLFFNLDGRLFESSDYYPDQTLKLLRRHGIKSNKIVYELSERFNNASAAHFDATLDVCRRQGFRIAIDDYGRGFSELRMLYEHPLDYLKIDRFFIAGIATDAKKRLLVTNIVNLAHVLGIQVVAEGIETEAEFLACKQVGCDLAQGYYVARPTTDLSDLTSVSRVVVETNRNDRRRRRDDQVLIGAWVKPLTAVRVDQPVSDVVQAFRKNPDQSILPVLYDDNRPAGVIREADLKAFIYSEFGRDLMLNPSFGKSINDFLIRCPIIDVHTHVETILEMYGVSRVSDGVLVTDDTHYFGFLTTDSLLRLVNEKNLALARDQNPLTKLPGNNSITNYIAAVLEDYSASWALLNFDIDNFKPFNDVYGFRQGDRAIMMFADLLRRTFSTENIFLGHIGGDDFFAGVMNPDRGVLAERVAEMLARFTQDAASLYSAEDRARGGILAEGRDGVKRSFPILTCSAAVVTVAEGPERPGVDTISRVIADTKRRAKATSDHMVFGHLTEPLAFAD